MGPGEQICKDVCVDTNQDPNNCGQCDKVCDQEKSESCLGGECEVLIPPYGAPMPEPLWV